MSMSAIAFGLALVAVLYAVYSLSVSSQSESETSATLARVPQHWFLAPVRLIVWLVFLPMTNTPAALGLALALFSAAALLFAL
jgi:hypothetical protein